MTEKKFQLLVNCKLLLTVSLLISQSASQMFLRWSIGVRHYWLFLKSCAANWVIYSLFLLSFLSFARLKQRQLIKRLAVRQEGTWRLSQFLREMCGSREISYCPLPQTVMNFEVKTFSFQKFSFCEEKEIKHLLFHSYSIFSGFFFDAYFESF